MLVAVPPDAADELAAAAPLLAGSRQSVDGFELPAGDPSRMVCQGRVCDRGSARAALLAAAWGAGLLVVLDLPVDEATLFLADLGRIGPFERRVPAAVAESSELDVDTISLLEHLAAGTRLGDAAKALHLSRRTADRRLANARRVLGVTTTSEALVAWRRRGSKNQATQD